MTKGREALQTFHAIKASDLASAFNDAMKRMVIAPGDYVPELTAPEGPSTGGGVQAMQRLRLVPRLAGFPTLVVGHANHAEGKAELRSFEHLAAMHRQRYKRPLALDRTAYEAFLPLAQNFLEALRLQTTVTGPSADLTEEADPESGAASGAGSSKVLLASLIVAVLLVLGAGLWMTLGKH